jgi:hypothetical protein
MNKGNSTIELNPEYLATPDAKGNLPLHKLLESRSSSVEDVLKMVEACPAALEHQNIEGYLPLHFECIYHGRSPILTRFIQLCPESLSVMTEYGYLPLHNLLHSTSSSIDDTLMMIEAYPSALQERDIDGFLALHNECMNQCRSSILNKCIELYPESLDDKAISMIIEKIKRKKNDIRAYASVLSLVFTLRPTAIYDYGSFIKEDIRKNPRYRRKILSLLPRHVFSRMHEADYADLNWRPRSAMLQLLLQINKQNR